MSGFILRRGGSPKEKKNILVRNGVNYSEDLVGGWVGSAVRRSSAAPVATKFSGPTIVSTDSALSFTLESSDGSVLSGLAHTFEPIDFTNYSNLLITGSYTRTKSGVNWRTVRLDALVLGNSVDDYFDSSDLSNNFYSFGASALPAESGPIDLLLPITSIVGIHRIGFGMLMQNSCGYRIDITGLELM